MNMNRLMLAAAGTAVCAFAPVMLAQATPPAPPVPIPPAAAERPAQPDPSAPKSPPKDDDLPSLDDLLGTGDGQTGVDDPAKAELDKLLSGKEIGEAFQQAVSLMGDAAKRLGESKDMGLATQRLQEDALRKLDQLISSLDKQSQQQQQQSQSQQQDEPRDSPRQRQQQQQQQQAQQPATGDPKEHDGPTLQEGALNPIIDSARAAWGALPARVRDMLMQGSADRFSSLYNQRTQEYYRRLAEESTQRP